MERHFAFFVILTKNAFFNDKKTTKSHIKEEVKLKGVFLMGRDDSKSKGTNKQSLPQTPNNAKIAPGEMREEIARELDELHQLAQKAKNNRK